MSVISIYKNIGETPLEALNQLRERMSLYKDEKLSYAGRLDPLAEGVMLVLSGDDVLRKDEFLGLDKTYVTEVLLGVSTDTGDVLGKIVESRESTVNRGEVESVLLKKYTGKQVQKYPVYSSKSFKGSYEDVRSGDTTEHSHEVEVYSASILDMYEINGRDVLDAVKKRIGLVHGDFRQEEIVDIWERNKYDTSYTFQIVKIKLTVSSGFYVRQFAQDLGEQLVVPALAYSIVRECVGNFSEKDCV